jgi:hypothetical protein
VLHSGMLRPYLKTLDKVGQGQTLANVKNY